MSVDDACDEPRDESGYESIPLRNPLRAKIAMRADTDPDSLFEAADHVIAEQARSYLSRARAELEEARAAMATAIADADARAGALDRLYRVAHDMKGQASTFGYPLATEICGLLCLLLARRPHLNDPALSVSQAHVSGLAVVLEHGLAGDGGDLGRQLVERLRGLCERLES
ncbi:MAG: hypothetical protein GEU92_16190 [Alphaproteobacteria bacterium]|nr:hypothetical protein [Alphaproteobacteria bacterium]